ncbi:hypothetical protein [Streptomyces hygroscopicus]|uniref:hypothetical protein n=1 Tax=Streptomyces hygroscopicus TaxID=1912 RepID=UPI001FCB2AEC|nr:hypothetical protein [Streptomyces hygroscopicus]BDH11967.1 hypothetical protein HOK021_31460 [Streptomyces hygroscopicus]
MLLVRVPAALWRGGEGLAGGAGAAVRGGARPSGVRVRSPRAARPLVRALRRNPTGMAGKRP